MISKDTSKDIVLIVDDIEINRVILCEILGDEYQTVEADSGEAALDIIFENDGSAKQVLPTAVLLDIMMPGIDGFEVLKRIKSHKDTKNIPVLIISASDSDENESRGLLGGAADYITKPFNFDIVRARVDNHINLARYNHNLEQLVSVKTSEVTRTYESTLEVLATIIEYRNLESGAHIRRTTLLTEVLVECMRNSDKFKEALEKENISSMVKASALHDIGKIAIPDSILLKPGKLTDEEFDVIKTHASIGSRIIDSISEKLPDNDLYLKYANEICHYHHERWDGTGYPEKLKGENIPLSARIVSVVDVYDALTSVRCYKDAMSHEVSLNILEQGKGTQFDPDIIDLVPSVADIFRKIEEEHRD